MKTTYQLLPTVLVGLAAALFSVGCLNVCAEELRSRAQRTVGLTYPDQAQTEFLKAVLKSMNLPYTVKATPDGEKVQWTSKDPKQEQQIQNRVSQYWFISMQCKGMKPPPPDKPAVSQLSCKNDSQ